MTPATTLYALAKAFTILYQKTCLQLYNYILKGVDYNEETAEELLTDVFSDAITYAFSLTPLHNVEAWLFRIAKCKVADRFRHLAREKKLNIATEVDIEYNLKLHTPPLKLYFHIAFFVRIA